MKKITLLLIATIVSFSFSVFAQQDFSQVKMKTTTVADNIYMIEGSGGNIGLFVSDDAVFIIDDQYAPLYGKIVGAVAEVTSKPIDFVINTHAHGDHAGSNANFEELGSYIIAQKNARSQLITDGKSDGLPKITFNKSINLNFDDEEIEVFHQTRAHTTGDAIIHFKTSNVFHMGDIYVQYGFPFIDLNRGGNINGMIEFLEAAIRKMNNESIIIPGHGQLATKAEVIEFHDMLMAIRNRIQSGINSNLSLEEIKATNPTQGFDGKGRSADDFVEVIYKGLVL